MVTGLTPVQLLVAGLAAVLPVTVGASGIYGNRQARYGLVIANVGIAVAYLSTLAYSFDGVGLFQWSLGAVVVGSFLHHGLFAVWTRL